MTKLIQKAQKGGNVSSLYETVTGKKWSTAKEEGLTSGSYEDNMKLRRRLLSGEFDLEKNKSNETVKEAMSIESSRDTGPRNPDLPERNEDAAKPLTNTNSTNTESFQEAFSKARKELGTGKTFEYKGKTFLTSYKEELDSNSKNEYKQESKLIPKQDKSKVISKHKQQESKQEVKQDKSKVVPAIVSKQEVKQESSVPKENYPWTPRPYAEDETLALRKPSLSEETLNYINNPEALQERLYQEKFKRQREEFVRKIAPASGAVEVTASPIEYLIPGPNTVKLAGTLLKPIVGPVVKQAEKQVEKQVVKATAKVLRKKGVKTVVANEGASDAVNKVLVNKAAQVFKQVNKANPAQKFNQEPNVPKSIYTTLTQATRTPQIRIVQKVRPQGK